MVNWLISAGQALWSLFQNVLPVERWIQALSSVLKYLGLSFLVLAFLFLVLLFGSWGFSANQRFVLAIILLFLIGAALLIVLLLAAKQGDLLLSPYERSLRSGRRYGTSATPQSRSDSLALPGEARDSQALPPSGGQKQIGDKR